MKSRARLALALAGAVAILVPGSAGAITVKRSGQAQPRQVQDHGKEQLDRRADAGRPTPRAAELPGAAEARLKLRRGLGRFGVVDVDARTGTPRVVARIDGFLTGPSAADAADVALGFVRRHAAAFGLDKEEIAALRISSRYTDVHGVTHIRWEQTVDGVPVFEHGVIANVAADGRLINVLGAPVADLALRSTEPQMPAAKGLARAFDDVDAAQPAPRQLSQRGAARETRFAGGHQARLVVVADGPGRLRLAWRTLTRKSSTEVYDHLVDSSTGDIVFRRNAVDFASGNVWEYVPFVNEVCAECGAAAGAQSLHDFGAGGTAWGTQSGRLEGNFAHVYTDVNDDDAVDSSGLCTGCGEIGPSSGTAWNYTFTKFDAFFSNCDELSTNFAACSWDWLTSNSWTTNLKQNGTQVYWFINNFHDWLVPPPFGFTAASGNFEGADKVDAQILDGANTDSGFPDSDHINNANMLTLPDGQPPRMQMYLFAPYFGGPEPSANGGDDASVIYHEYVHGLSNRLVTDASNNPALFGHHARSMGEGWSDWYAMDYLEGNNLDEDDSSDQGEMNVGVYVQGGDIHALRTEGLDCEVGGPSDADCPGAGNAGQGGYTLADMGKILCNSEGCFPEFHADGEIWAQALWDVRQALMTAMGGNSLDGAGVTRAREIITEGMRLSPPAPTFLDMRNAILQAEINAGGQQFNTVYEAFRTRGMGYFAAALGTDDATPVEDFSPVPACPCGSVTGRITDTDTGAGIAGAVVEIPGGFGELVAQTDGSGNFTIPDVPEHTYPYLIVTADGYDAVIGRNITVGASGAQLNASLKRDWASIFGGAQIVAFDGPDFSDFGCGPAGAFDQSFGSGWGSSAVNAQDPSLPDGAKSVTIRLPQAINVEKFAVDPSATCGDDPTAMVTSLKIETSANGTSFTTAGQGSFTLNDAGTLKDVAATAGTQGVQFVRFTMQSNLGPVNGQGASYRDFMDVTEMEVYGKPAPASTPPPSGGGTTTPPPGGTTQPPIGPTISNIKVKRTKLRNLVRRKPLIATMTVSGAGRVSGRMLVSRRTAFKLRLTKKRRGGPVTIGRGSATVLKAGTVTVRLRLTAKARKQLKRRLRRTKSLTVTLRLVATDASGRAGSPARRTAKIRR